MLRSEPPNLNQNNISCSEMHLKTPSAVDGPEQDCSISIANALEMLQSYTKPSTCLLLYYCDVRKRKYHCITDNHPKQIVFHHKVTPL